MGRIAIRLSALAFAGAFAGAACGPTSRDPGPGDDDSPDAMVTPPIPSADAGPGCQAIDVLFVVDNSGSMEQEQTNLVANFPGFVAVLDASGLDYRIGVTTTGRDYDWTMTAPPPLTGGLPMSQDGGDNGALLQKCSMTKRWIDKADPDVAGTFSCLANVGTSGPGMEMPLGALRDAFEDRIADSTNLGFHRPDALLAMVVLTDENDCSHEHPVTLGFTENLCGSSSEPVANYIQFLDGYTGNHTRWATAVIAGMGPGNCSSSFGDAEEATRLHDFVQQVGANATMSSICDGDLSTGLMQALSLFQSACGSILL